MFCDKCGAEIKEQIRFCANCGNDLMKDKSESTIIFERKKQFYGMLVPIKVYLDGNLVATINSGNQVSVPVSTGNHKLSFNLWSGNGQYDITVSRANQTVKVLFKLSMKMFTSEPKIVSIEDISN